MGGTQSTTNSGIVGSTSATYENLPGQQQLFIRTANDKQTIAQWEIEKEREYPAVIPKRDKDVDLAFLADNMYETSQELIFFIDALAEHLLKGKFGTISELAKLNQPGICSKYVTILSSQLGEIANTLPLRSILHPGGDTLGTAGPDGNIKTPNQATDNVVFFEKDVFELMNVHTKNNPGLKQKLCDRLAYFFIRLIQTYSAIYLAIHPRFRDENLYKKSRNSVKQNYSRLIDVSYSRTAIKQSNVIVYSDYTRRKRKEEIENFLTKQDPDIIAKFNDFKRLQQSQQQYASDSSRDVETIKSQFISDFVNHEKFNIPKSNPYFSLLNSAISGTNTTTIDNSSEFEKLAQTANMHEFRRNALMSISRDGKRANINICKFTDKKRIDEITGIAELIALYEIPNIKSIRDNIPENVQHKINENIASVRAQLLRTFGDPKILKSSELPKDPATRREFETNAINYTSYLKKIGCEASSGQPAVLISNEIAIDDNPEKFIRSYEDVLSIQRKMKQLHAQKSAQLLGFLRMMFIKKSEARKRMDVLGENPYTRRHYIPLAPV
jgi:hypothetical protein